VAPATQAVYEWSDYVVRYDGATHLRVGDRLVQPIDDGLFQVRFENQLGLTSIQPLDEHRPCCSPLVLEVISPKFPSVEQHLDFFTSLLDDLLTRAARLPFAISADTARGVVDVPSPPTPLFTLHYLLQHAQSLREAAQTILARPHRRLDDTPEIVPLAAVSEADPDVLLDVLTSPDRWVRASGFSLATRLRGHAPAEVWQRRPEETLDTLENRFVKAFLRDLLFAAEQLPLQPWWVQVSSDRQRVIHETESMLRLTLAQPMFAEVGDLRRIPSSSRVLMRREGYREVLDAWRLFNLARRPFFGPLQHAIDLRDIATLYEVWCFFALVEEISAALGIEPELLMRVSDEHGLNWRSEARFGSTGTLVYNQSVRGYSVGLRPDYLWYRNGKLEVALDAKFRLDRSDWSDDTSQATVKNDDLYKMHTYRDALELRAAVVVYPGDLPVFWSMDREKRKPELQELLTAEVVGIGALNLEPATDGSSY
jgi:predicted component of viral defense system (DUF524 family)